MTFSFRHTLRVLTAFLAITLFAAIGCNNDTQAPTLEPGSGALLELDLSSPDFGDMRDIPARFTCDGANDSPRLQWGPVPEGTRSLVIIVDDPGVSGGVFNHWVAYDLPVELNGLAAAQQRVEVLPAGGRQGTNGAGAIGWTGPCPPAGQTHQYDFFLYALSSLLELQPGASRDEVARAMRDAGVVGVGTYSGLYARP